MMKAVHKDPNPSWHTALGEASACGWKIPQRPPTATVVTINSFGLVIDGGCLQKDATYLE